VSFGVAFQANRGQIKEHLTTDSLVCQVVDLSGRRVSTRFTNTVSAAEHFAAQVLPLL